MASVFLGRPLKTYQPGVPPKKKTRHPYFGQIGFFWLSDRQAWQKGRETWEKAGERAETLIWGPGQLGGSTRSEPTAMCSE